MAEDITWDAPEDIKWDQPPAAPVSTERAAGRQAVKQSMKAAPEYIEVPVLGPDGQATGQTEKVLKPSKADPIGRGAMSVLPFGQDIAAMARSGALPMSAEHSAEKERIIGEGEASEEAYPKPYMGGQAGSLALQAMALRRLPLPGSSWGQAALPEAATISQRLGALGARTAGGAVGGATMGGVTGLGEGTDFTDRLKHGALGTLVGGVFGGASVPFIEGIVGGAKLGYDKLGRPLYERVRGALDPNQVAKEKVAGTFYGDSKMSVPEYESRLASGEPVIIGDVGSTATNNLARTAANISPEAQETLEGPLRQRFASQAERVKSDVESYLPGSKDYVKTIEELEEKARKANDPAYRRAYAQGETGMFNDNLYELTRTPTVRKAMQEVETTALDRPIYGEPRGEIVSPFTFDKTGNLVAKEGMSASDANLAYWDQVSRRLKDKMTTLEKGGEYEAAKDVKNLRKDLLTTLDDMVPSFKTARSTAAEGFGAETAYEAGINYAKATDPKKISELSSLIEKFTEPEKELFQRGFLFHKVGQIERAADPRNITNQSFMGTSPLERRKIAAAMEPDLAAKLEARLRTEQLMNQLYGSVTQGSTTARQQLQKDIMSYTAAGAVGAGAGYSSDDKTTGSIAGLMVRAAKGKVDANVAREVAKILVSRDPALLDQLVSMSAKNPKILQTLRTLQNDVPKGALGTIFGSGTVGLGGKRGIAAGQAGMKATEEK